MSVFYAFLHQKTTNISTLSQLFLWNGLITYVLWPPFIKTLYWHTKRLNVAVLFKKSFLVVESVLPQNDRSDLCTMLFTYCNKVRFMKLLRLWLLWILLFFNASLSDNRCSETTFQGFEVFKWFFPTLWLYVFYLVLSNISSNILRFVLTGFSLYFLHLLKLTNI